MHGECDICGSCEHVRHINLYVSGSEGLTVCTECEMHIVTYVRSLRQIAAKAKLRMVKFYKDQQERLKKVEIGVTSTASSSSIHSKAFSKDIVLGVS